jgi:hypothetical protein
MTAKRRTKLLREGDYVAEIEIERIEAEAGWPPYLSLKDAKRLDELRDALKKRDLHRAGEIGRVYQLTPVADR